jgi:hypothetical protein
MLSTKLKSLCVKFGLSAILLLVGGAAAAQQQVALTAAPGTAWLPDGSPVPMWGYACGAAVANSTATCAALGTKAGGGWAPVVITVPSGQDLQINLTNNLPVPPGATAGIPTSLVIVGQLGGGLGDLAQRTTTPAPDHSKAQAATTWPIASSGPSNTPPSQLDRVQSFSTQVETGATASLCWGPSCKVPSPALRPGTYLFESGTHPSIQGPMGLYGIIIVTAAPTVDGTGTETAAGTAYPGVSYDGDVALLFSEIDPIQNTAVDTAVHTAGFSETMVWSGQPGGCGNAASTTFNQCYPPAVNYTPLYYLINGVAFDRTNPSASVDPVSPGTLAPATAPGSILVRMVNAGLRMHVPSIVGSQTGAGGVPGFSLIAEDGNPLPGLARVQNEVFLAAGKTYDVMITPPAAGLAALPVYDRELSLSGNAVNRDAGMLAYLGVNGSKAPTAAAPAVAAANPDVYNSLVAGMTFTVSDPSKGVLANDVNVFGATLLTTTANGTVTLNRDGTFKYVPAGTGTSDSFSYCANGSVTGGVCSSGITATVTLGPCGADAKCVLELASGITLFDDSYTSSVATALSIKPPGILANDVDGAGYPLTVALSAGNAPVPSAGLSLTVDPNGGFNASVANPGTYTFTYKAQNSQGTISSGSATVTLVFPTANGPVVTVLDGADKLTVITDYRWIIEEDRTFFVDPNCTTNPLPSTCPVVTPQGTPAVFGTNFHTSHMPVVAQGCTGPLSCESGQTLLGTPTVCDVGNGGCRTDGTQQAPVDPRQAHLDPTKRYYISVLPGDAAHPFIGGNGSAPANCAQGPYNPDGSLNTACGHGMGGAPIATGQTAVTVLTEPSPYPPGKLTVFVFEDDYPLNGEHDAGGGVDVISPQEPGLGSFQITLFDDAGGTGDATGRPTYDMFNMPLTNSLAGTIDPTTNLDACPISPVVTNAVVPVPSGTFTSGTQGGIACTVSAPCTCTAANPCYRDSTQKGIVGMIVTCPTYESDGQTLSPLAGQAVVPNLYPGRYGVMATPGADRIARGEEWLQTNTLDGQKAHDSFIRIGEPAYFQEYGPAGYHVSIGFANPKIINDRKAGVCGATGVSCTNEVKGHITTARMSRPPDQRLYGSGSRDGFAFTQCFASLGDPDGADFAFSKCDDQGNFDFTGIPAGNWKITIFDQWNDQIVDGIMQPVGVSGSGTVLDMGEVAVHQWQANIYTRTFLDLNGTGVSHKDAQGNDVEPGLALVLTNIRYRDGSFSNRNNTDLNGYAPFNEVFPLFSWYVLETDSTRYKTTGVHVVYDAGGPTDGTCTSSTAPCGTSSIGQHLANTYEAFPLPSSPINLSVPGAVYCPEGADCNLSSIKNGPVPSSTTNHSTGRIDPPFWFGTYGYQGFSGQSNFLEFGKRPFVPGETGGIHGHVVYSSTRPFDDPQMLVQNTWEPLVPHVRVNLYKEGFDLDGITPTLTLIDHTETSSFDDWAQGFRSDGVPNMNCPGQATTDLFFYSLQNQPQWLDLYGNGAGHTTALPYNSQYKCYDGMHNWNQLQPAPYDGLYAFPSVTGFDPSTGKPSGTNCTACGTNPDTTDPYRFGTPMLPAGKYVVEVVVPPGYELVKEEDKNILIGDNFIAPVAQQFGGLSNIFILPDQAQVGALYNANNAQNPTQSLGMTNFPGGEEPPGALDMMWPCVGAERVVPDYISLFPGSAEVAPFAGAKRHLCDRKEVTLADQSAALAKFYIFTSTHVASHYTGVITDDFTAEFDPFSPQFGEKFAPAYLPVSVKDWTGNEISRTYSDQWGAYNGLSYSTWEVNPPNPTGYAPTMMVVCMNDAGSGTTPDPLFQPAYSQFCYELPFMPGQTGYFDTPVVPNSAFSEGYNHPDCAYPDATPAISTVNGDGVGPWVSAPGNTLTITALGDKLVDSYGYSGPAVTTAPYNQQKVTRHYGFGSTAGTVTIGGVQATVTSWSDLQIQVTVPGAGAGQPQQVPVCDLQQQVQYGGPGNHGARARCGQLVVTAANGKSSVDAVTVTIGGKAPTRLAAGQTIQSAIDAALPGDLIIVPPGVYKEMVLMWKPLRLQGVGAASVVIDANAHPAAKLLDPWRKKVVCLFGLTLDGRPNPTDPSCSSTWTAASGGPGYPTMIVDRVPTEGILGWDATLNGNLAEQLIEPSLMGAYEGAALTVLAKGVNIPSGSGVDAWGTGAEAAFPDGSTLLSAEDCTSGPRGTNPWPSNFYCNPSSIDGLSMTNSSQGGGGIFVHGWAHHIQIANNRVYSNTGSLSGGITIGQGEHIDLPLGGNGVTNLPPGSCESSNVTNLGLAYCYNTYVNVHHNAVTVNSSMGDELFSSTPAGAGGVSFANGSDWYTFTHNWVCGNISTGDGGGVAHIGWSKNGLIEHNAILFNQSTNPTITTNGGGVLVMGAPDPDPPCGENSDKDCVPAPGSIGPSDGTGLGLVINANLILGNSADSGSGGGLRLQHVNGTDILNFPNGNAACKTLDSCAWNSVQVTNNIIANNVAGWDGAGISLQDALVVNIVNNTIVSNDSTASSGALLNSLFAPLASAPTPNCTTNNGTQSCPQVAGLVSVTNSAILQANLPAATGGQTGLSCPPGHGTAGSCRYYSVPVLSNNVIWQNRSFFIGVGAFGQGTQNQQKIVTLYDSFTTTPAPSQPQAPSTVANGGGTTITGGTGACVSPVQYWDVGVRGDSGPGNHVVVSGTTLQLFPAYTVLTDASDYPGANNTNGNPDFVSQYCNGSRVPPELGSMGFLVPPGTNETNALPNPVFSLLPSATVDEGNNWINMRWGPLALANPATGATLADYDPASGSAAINYIPPSASTAWALAPNTDFYGNPRKTAGNQQVDAGAVEVQAGGSASATLTAISPTSGAIGTTVAVTITGTGLAGASAVLMPGGGVSCNVTGTPTSTTVNASCTIGRGANPTSRAVRVTVPSGTATGVAFQVTRATLGVSAPSPALNGGGTSTKNGTITITNTASGTTAGPFTFTAPATVVKEFGPGTFSVQPGGTCTSTTVLAPGSNCTVNVQYVPGRAVPASAHLRVAGTGISTSPLNGPSFPAN